MYLIIRIIVHAKDKEEAWKMGEDALNKLVKREIFDCFRTFEREDRNGWKGDWAHLPPMLLANSPEGRHFIDVGWQYTVEGFTEAFEQVKLAVQYLSLREIMERTYPEDLPEDIKKKINILSMQVYFDELGLNSGYPKYLYHDDEPILSKSELEFALKPDEGLNVYVIPADVHY